MFTKIIVVSARNYLALVFPLVDILLKGTGTQMYSRSSFYFSFESKGLLEILFGGTTIFQTYFSHYKVGVMGFVSLCITITLLIFSSHNTTRTSNSSNLLLLCRKNNGYKDPGAGTQGGRKNIHLKLSKKHSSGSGPRL